jgi:predicted nucleic acid-binding protein
VKVIVDTCVWSMALQRGVPSPGPEAEELRQLVDEARVQMLGAIRQEILSGIRVRSQFEGLRDRLRGFPDLALVNEDYALAAEYFTALRAKGIQGSNTDFLICAAAARRDLPVLTMDKDFLRYRTVVPLKLHRPRVERSKDASS